MAVDCSERCPSAVQVAQIGSMTLASPPGPSQGLHSDSKSQLPTYLAPMGSMMLASIPGPSQALPSPTSLRHQPRRPGTESNYRQPTYLALSKSRLPRPQPRRLPMVLGLLHDRQRQRPSPASQLIQVTPIPGSGRVIRQ